MALIEVTDQNKLVDTKKFKFGKFPFKKFNPIQSRIYEHYEEDSNFLIAAATSSGKTILAELVASYEIRKRGGKVIYLAPLKALAQEKYDDWTDKSHHFSDLNISICTGDYRLTADRKQELEDAHIILMTSEMLNSRCRNINSEKSKFLSKIGTLIIDESHLITVPNRGDHLEAGLMKFTEMNPSCRVVGLSATMPNVEEIAEWLNKLNDKDTVFLRSIYRPCPLFIHFEKYTKGRTYEDTELQKVNLGLQIVEHYEEDKFLIFVHTKRTGELMRNALTKLGIKCEFHNANLDKNKRVKIEKQFKEGSDLRVIIATSTLAWGVNLPARRVIVLGVHRGLDEVAVYDILQETGRAGRPQYDPAGDAYILLPENAFDMHKLRIKKQQKIQSQMLDENNGHHKVLAFHLISEIYQGNVQGQDDVYHWYKRSLASFQANDLPQDVVDNTIDSLKKCGAIWEEDGKYTVTSIGKIASMFYYSPYDISDLKKNFDWLFNNRKENDDLCVSFALANIDTHKFGIVNKFEREEMSQYKFQLGLTYSDALFEPAVKMGYAYHLLINGNNNYNFANSMRTLQWDFPRLNQVLYSLDGFVGKWNKKDWLRRLQLRVIYGVKDNIVDFCQLPHIGKVRASRLWGAGIRNLDDIINKKSTLRTCSGLNGVKLDEIIAEAKRLVLLSSM